ncbi:MAG: Phosphoribosylamine--glycine ligase [uncultured Acidimicrobiales bacterium]|uniref:phosphoribosylamine--glycine ligase n=1 Tax=uncultured Acidimicrobiales bacterium TaxID=310071 RepID=A0A6J4I0E0_9ACTN|nr:MAG: Phosphoribosylamine--glycine ligase [uncultured Acidimicrobiales bacterium]
MRVHVVGNGGREAALRAVLGRTAALVDEPDGADLVVIGPEPPLTAGLADELRARGLRVFGPGADGARLEGSKAWMKQVLVDAGVPTARHGWFTELDDAVAFLRDLPGSYVVKTDYLAGGKGVLVTDSLSDAMADAGAKLTKGAILVEERMTGPELSLLCVCDGKRAVPLATARDYKRIDTGDVGPMTGGMGAFSPVADIDGEALAKDIVQPTLDALRERGIDYRGVLYAGLMLTPEGAKVVEFNVRFGDPEAQVVLPRFSGDLAAFLAEAADGDLRTEPSFDDSAWVTVVLAAGGYPVEPYDVGHRIEGMDAAAAMERVVLFEAGVRRDAEGSPLVAGGRVLDVTAHGPTVAAARERAYAAAERISFPGMQYRTDIAQGA